MNKVLVTGGTGYIGSHTVVELINAGFDLEIIDNLSNSKLEVLEGIKNITGVEPKFHKIDLVDFNVLKDFFQSSSKFDAIIHFAAYKAVGESVTLPLKYYHNNLIALMNIMNCMREFTIVNLVFSSSCTVYGQAEILPVTEESPIIKADSPYGNTKQISEEIIEDVVHSSDKVNSISLRYFNPIGAHESAEIGELPLGVPDNLVPYITQTAAGIRTGLKIFGNDYNTEDGTAIRDYIHIVDLAKAHVRAVKRLLKKENKKRYEVFNLGTGNGNSVLEVVKTFEKVTGEKLNYKITDRRLGDIEQVWADTSFANAELGWETKKTLEDALLSAWNWEKKYRNL